MRLRERRRIEKESRIAASMRFPRWKGVPGPAELLDIALDPAADLNARYRATSILSRRETPQALLDAFLTSTDDLVWLADILGVLGKPNAVGALARALHDEDHERRRWAAMALGWNRRDCPAAARALSGAVADRSQPPPVRLMACWALEKHYWPQATPALAIALGESDVELRFAAVRALNSMRNRKSLRLDPKAKAALESVLTDSEHPLHNWWAVGKEALAVLAFEDSRYLPLFQAEIARIQNEAVPSREDKMFLLEYEDWS